MSAQGCPAWCNAHPPLEPVTVHTGSVTFAGLTVALSQWENGTMRMYVDALDVEDGVSLDGALTLARALERAAHTISGVSPEADSIRQTDEALHASWCNDHKTEVDGQDVTEVCRLAVTVGEVTVDLEDSPSWPDDERRQVVPPSLPDSWVSAADAKDLAAALIEAARLIEVDEAKGVHTVDTPEGVNPGHTPEGVADQQTLTSTEGVTSDDTPEDESQNSDGVDEGGRR